MEFHDDDRKPLKYCSSVGRQIRHILIKIAKRRIIEPFSLLHEQESTPPMIRIKDKSASIPTDQMSFDEIVVYIRSSQVMVNYFIFNDRLPHLSRIVLYEWEEWGIA